MAFNLLTGFLKFIIAAIIITATVGFIFYTVQYKFNKCSRLTLPKYVSILPVDGNIVVNWLEPEDKADCNVTYFLKYNEDGRTNSFNTTVPYFVFQANSTLCTSVHIEINLMLGSNKIDDLHGKLDFEPVDLSPVNNLQLYESKTSVMAEWDLPISFERCNIEYEVFYAYGHNSKSRKFITRNQKTSFDIDMTVCAVLQVSVTPIVQSVPGPNTIHNYTLGVCELESHPVEDLDARVCDSCEYIFPQE